MRIICETNITRSLLKVMPRNKGQEKMSLISVHVPKRMLEELDELVRKGIYPNRSEAIRAAIRELLYKESLKPAARQAEEVVESEEEIEVLPGR
jgi:Arc/MetJ-type ribon-helix-helix transcriptional regulator